MNIQTVLQLFRRHFDWTLALTIMVITLLGLLNLYSATRYVPQRGLFGQQIVWIALGTVFYLAFALIDYRTWLRASWILLMIGILALLGVMFFGHTVNRSTRWVGIGPFGGQPSEFIKIAVILELARLVHDSESGLSPIDLAVRLAGLIAVIVLIVIQPDMGTAVMVAMICLSILFLTTRSVRWPLAGFGGLLAAVVLVAFRPDLAAAAIIGAVCLAILFVAPRRLRWLFGGGGAFFLMVPTFWKYVIWEHVLRPKQKGRIMALIDPASDPSGLAWQGRQSVFAIGSGQGTGKGFMQGTQNKLNLVPEQMTDFPFSVWAEEWGFAGSLVFLTCYLVLIFWTLNVASETRDRFGATLCCGVAAFVFWHVFVNISMVVGIAPVVGVTLPLVSYGGSSMLTFFVALGLVASVSIRRHARA